MIFQFLLSERNFKILEICHTNVSFDSLCIFVLILNNFVISGERL